MNDAVSSVIGCLRKIKSDELPLMLSWRNAPDVRANMYTRHEISLDEHLSWWKRISCCADQQYFMYENFGAPLGIVAFNNIDLVHQNASWAFYASPEAPLGTGSKMEFLALEYAFDSIHLHKLSCEVLAFNSGVIRLHEKFGFKTEGILRAQHKINDVFVDIFRLGIICDEWMAHKDSMRNKIFRIATH